MLDFVNQITDKPRWWEKVHDEVIVGRWRAEACGNEEQQRLSDKHLDGKCFEYVRWALSMELNSGVIVYHQLHAHPQLHLQTIFIPIACSRLNSHQHYQDLAR